MHTPILSVNLSKLSHNLEIVSSLCEKNNASLTPVTKVIMGDPQICKMYAKKTGSLSDSRIVDIVRMKQHSIQAEYMLIRTPSLQNATQVVDVCDISLHSEIKVLSAMNDYCQRKKMTHKVIFMIEIGDLREGILIENFPNILSTCRSFTSLDFIGVGCNATCFAGLIPTPDNLRTLQKAADLFASIMGYKAQFVSGGGSNLMPLLLSNKLPPYINHLRIGESIVMGVDAINKKAIPGCYQDCFTLTGEIIELKTKPSIPKKPLTKNAFGETPTFVDKGLRKRAIIDIGRLDTDVTGLIPTESGISILGASSDHLILDVEESERDLHVGDRLSFYLNYSSLLFAMSSEYVHKTYLS